MMRGLKDIMPVKKIIDSNEVCDGNREILVCCTNTWVSEESLWIPYTELIHSHWALHLEEQDIIKIEEEHIESVNIDSVNKFINSEDYMSAEMCSSMDINEVSEEESTIHGRKENVCHVRPFNCESSNKSTRFSGLNPHESSHTGEKTFKCEVCHKGFTQKCNLKMHDRTHKGEKAFKCEVCDKGFTQKGNLKTHKLTHNGEKSFKCEECHRGFARKGDLKVHKRTHTGERPFKCEVCGKGFTQTCNLTVHERTHTVKKRFKCDVCDKAFTTKGSLTMHKRTHTVEKLEKVFKCEACHQEFTKKGDLDVHILYVKYAIKEQKGNLTVHERRHFVETFFKC